MVDEELWEKKGVQMKLWIFSWNFKRSQQLGEKKGNKASVEIAKSGLGVSIENKITRNDYEIVRSLGVRRCIDWSTLNSKGAIGGVILFWDNRVLQL